MHFSLKKTLKSRLGYGLWLTVTVIVLLELVLRAYFAVQIGPRVLAYGSSSFRNENGDRRDDQLMEAYDREEEDYQRDEERLNTVYTHKNKQGGYLKFFPNEAKFHKDIDTGEVFPVTVNSHGFRGKEYTVDKPEGVIRILTLGASSTVGLWNRDHETYPVRLEQMLNERCQGPQRFEVINFAIPHAIADQILAMFMAEGLALKPDAITFYEGRNDSLKIHPMDFLGGPSQNGNGEENEGLLVKLRHELTRRLVVARLVDELVNNNARVSAEKTRRILETIATKTSNEFMMDLDQIRKIAQERNILFIVSSQQANSKSWYGMPESERMKLRGVTYRDEVDQIQALVSMGESISGYEFNFLVHDRLMRDLKDWALREQLPFVDFIEILDHQRHHLVSWVHLDPYANQLLAGALADEILRRKCPQLQASKQ